MQIVCLDPQGVFNAYGFWYRFPVMGLQYIARIWQKLGHSVTIFSEAIHGYVLDGEIGKLKPSFTEAIKKADVFAVSVMTATAKRCYAVVRAVRRINPRIHIILGGPHVTYQDDDLDFSCVIVKGEGENLASAALEQTEGVLYSTGLVEDLSSLPLPDFSLIPGYCEWLAGALTKPWRIWERRLPRIVPILGSRGCPFNCTFCIVTKMHGARYRFRLPEEIVEEMKIRIRDGASPNFFFYDDNIYGKRSWLIELCELMIREIIEGMHLPQFCFRAEVRVNVALGQNYPEVLELLQRAHCKYLLLGFESINPATLEEYQKRQSREDIETCIKRLRSFGIGIHGMFAVGADEDTVETPAQTARFALRQGIDTIQLSQIFPIPGTRLQQDLEAQGRVLTHDWNLYDGSVVVFCPKNMTVAESQRAYLEGWQDFYLHKPKMVVAALLGKFLWLQAHGKSFREVLTQASCKRLR